MDEIGWAPSPPYNQDDAQGLSGEAGKINEQIMIFQISTRNTKAH